MDRAKSKILQVSAFVLAIAAAGFGSYWVLRHAFERPYTEKSLRERWCTDSTLDRLRKWSRQFIDADKPLPSRVSDWPQTDPPILYLDRLRDERHNVIALEFELGGADNHHGLIIGR